MDIKNLPDSFQMLLEELLVPLNPDTPPDILAMLLTVKVAQFACFEGFRIQGVPGSPLPPNVYTIIIAPSGIGKNRPLKHIDKYIFSDWHRKIEKEWGNFAERESAELAEIAEEKYQGLKSKKAEFIDKNEPRSLQLVTGTGTPEGITADREMLQKWGKGSTLVVIEEGSDYITSSRGNDEFLSMMKNIYDHGDSDAKSIKASKESRSVRAVPNNFIMTSPLCGINDNEAGAKLKYILSTGAARRSFVVIQKEKKILTRELLKAEQEAYEMWERERAALYDMVSSLLESSRGITVTAKASKIITDWRVEMSERSAHYNDDIMGSAISGAYWKGMKLAGAFAAWEGSRITAKIMESVKYQSDYFLSQLEKLNDITGNDDFKKIFEFILFKGVVTKMDVRDSGIIGWNQFSFWWMNNESLLGEYCEFRGYELVKNKVGKNGVAYKLEEKI